MEIEACGSAPDGNISTLYANSAWPLGAFSASEQEHGWQAYGDGNNRLLVVVLITILMQ